MLLLVLSLTAACGARLTDTQKLAATRGVGSSSAGPGTESAEIAVDQGPVDSSGDGPTAVSSAGGSTGPAAGAKSAAAAAAGVPKGGNGGATDTGVTATEISIAVLSDRTGPVPGIFESTVKAVQAWANYVNSKGGLFGRKVKVIAIDAKTSTADDRAGAIQACSQAFALVGSMSAFDDGGAEPIGRCGIPDLSTTVVTIGRDKVATSYPAFPNVSDYSNLIPQKWLAEKFPEAPKRSGMLWLNAAATRFNANKNMEAMSTLGFQFIYKKQVEVVEPNFTPFVVDMRNAGVQYVTMVSDNNSIARLLKAMRSQNFEPPVKQFDTVIYDQKFLAQAGAAAENTYTFLPAVPLDEASSSKEYQLYIDSLKRSAGGQPDGFFGVYAWSAARMFQQAVEATGPALTRAKLLEYLRNLHAWDGHGLHPAHDIGNKRTANCTVVLQVKGGKFTRAAPAGSGYLCDTVPMYKVTSASS